MSLCIRCLTFTLHRLPNMNELPSSSKEKHINNDFLWGQGVAHREVELNRPKTQLYVEHVSESTLSSNSESCRWYDVNSEPLKAQFNRKSCPQCLVQWLANISATSGPLKRFVIVRKRSWSLRKDHHHCWIVCSVKFLHFLHPKVHPDLFSKGLFTRN